MKRCQRCQTRPIAHRARKSSTPASSPVRTPGQPRSQCGTSITTTTGRIVAPAESRQQHASARASPTSSPHTPSVRDARWLIARTELLRARFWSQAGPGPVARSHEVPTPADPLAAVDVGVAARGVAGARDVCPYRSAHSRSAYQGCRRLTSEWGPTRLRTTPTRDPRSSSNFNRETDKSSSSALSGQSCPQQFDAMRSRLGAHTEDAEDEITAHCRAHQRIDRAERGRHRCDRGSGRGLRLLE